MLSRKVRAVALLLVAGGVAACAYALLRPEFDPDRHPPGTAGNAATGKKDAKATTNNDTPVEQLPGFKAVTQDAGITFRTQFLPGEQGAKFKVNLYDHGSGVAVGDYNGDGYDDLYFCNQLGPNALYRNDGQGGFDDVTDEAGALRLDDRVCVAATFSDYDNDGDQDLYVTSTRGGNVLFNNDGKGRFSDVTTASGLTQVAHSQCGTFFDYDNDGDLDLFVANTARWTGEFDSQEQYFVGPANIYTSFPVSPPEKNVLYRNDGDGTFTDVTAESGVAGRGWSADTVVWDYDDDGWLDLLVTSMFGWTQLFHNQEGVFRDVTKSVLPATSWGAVGGTALDFNNDGLLDLCVVDMHSDMWMATTSRPEDFDEKEKYGHTVGPRIETSPSAVEVEQSIADAMHIDYSRAIFGNTLFKNLGQGRFEEVSDRSGVETLWPWGLAAGDYDNDGHQDLFIPSGMGFPFCYWRNYLLMNDGDGTFRDESRQRGLEPRPDGDFQESPIGGQPSPRSSRSAANLDLDLDGRLDLVVNNFNDAPYLFRNEFPAGNFLQFRLRGTRSNRDAIGAVVRLIVGDEVLTRQVNPTGGYLAQSSKTVHFGLGQHDKVDRVEIRWPGGETQTVDGPSINQLHEITQL